MQTTAREHAARAEAAALERATLSLCNKVNSSLTSRMLSEGATSAQIVEALAILSEHEPKPAPNPAPQNQTGPSDQLFSGQQPLSAAM